MQQIFVKDIKDSTFNTDVLAKLKKEHIPLQIYWHNEPEAKFSGAILHDFHKLCLEVEIAGRHLQFTCYEMINGDITVDYEFGNKHYTTEDILVRNKGYRVNENLTVGDPIDIWINKKDHTQINTQCLITFIDSDSLNIICNSFTNPARVQEYSIRIGSDNHFILQSTDKLFTLDIYNPIWCPLVPRDPDEEEDEENESCDE